MKLPEKKRNIIAEFLLLLFAIVLLAIAGPLGILYTFAKCWKFYGFKGACRCVAFVLRRATIGIDQTGNVVLGDFFNDYAKTKDGHPYGDVDETISSATGKNERDGTLTRFGRFFTSVLSVFEYNHAIKWIEE
jgi:hypothetical protein